jgi:glycosyltransferase involved in cell wall biosynthesis
MKIKFLLSYPHSLMSGGGVYLIEKVKSLLEKEHQVSSIDYLSHDLEADIVIAFGFTWISPEVVKLYKSKGMKVLLFPIFDRNKPSWQFKLLAIFRYLPILNAFTLRKELLDLADQIVALSESEMYDLVNLFGGQPHKISVLKLGISDEIIELDKTITKDLFVKKHGFDNFVFYPAATISKRKDQLLLINALKNTDIKLVINGANFIQDNLDQEFKSLTDNNPNILVLGKMDLEMLVSCYKAAKVSVSLSHAETAGLANLEAAYLGCNLVVSRLPAFKNYLGNNAIYVDWKAESVLDGVKQALKLESNLNLQDFVIKNYTWISFYHKLSDILNKLST